MSDLDIESRPDLRDAYDASTRMIPDTSSTIYIVVGSHGEYDCRMEWKVAAYLDAATANDYLSALNDALIAWNTKDYDERWELAGEWDCKDYNGRHILPCSLDPVCGLVVSSEPQKYRIDKVELRSEIPL